MMETPLTTHYGGLCKQMSSAQNNGEFCDLELVCDGYIISVHKVIVCLQSPVIKAACTGQFAESAGRYEIKDCSYHTAKKMVDYLYTGDYETGRPGPVAADTCKISPDGEIAWYATAPSEVVSEVVQHIRMFSLADKYLIDGLLELSKTKFRKAIREERDTCVFSRFAAEVYDLQCESSKILRDIVIESIRERVAVTPLKPDVQQAVDGLIDDIPEFAGDLARSYLQRPILGHCTTCGTHKLVSISTLQCRCAECGKGSASPLGSWYEGKPFRSRMPTTL
ncbi:hypothetical protein GGI35DRAFT_458828 [Trichoderma velutinum]